MRWVVAAALCAVSVMWMPARASAQDDGGEKFNETWEEIRPTAEKDGLSKAQVYEMYRWTQLEYLFGYCFPYIKPDRLAYWNGWIDRLPEGRGTTETAQAIKRIGENVFLQGSHDGRMEPPSKIYCETTADSWVRDMESIIVKRPSKK